jgi:hypothetical protein
MWFVFCPQTGGPLEIHQIEDGVQTAKTMEFYDAANAAAWAVRFLVEIEDVEDPKSLPSELHVINLEEGVTIVITKKTNEPTAI